MEPIILKFGKYRGQDIRVVPGPYLVGLYKSAQDQLDKYPLVREYIVENFGALIPTKSYLFLLTPICDTLKTCFVDQQDADKELKRIRKDPRKHKKPIRSYQCERCGFWHHTSKQL